MKKAVHYAAAMLIGFILSLIIGLGVGNVVGGRMFVKALVCGVVSVLLYALTRLVGKRVLELGEGEESVPGANLDVTVGNDDFLAGDDGPTFNVADLDGKAEDAKDDDGLEAEFGERPVDTTARPTPSESAAGGQNEENANAWDGNAFTAAPLASKADSGEKEKNPVIENMDAAVAAKALQTLLQSGDT